MRRAVTSWNVSWGGVFAQQGQQYERVVNLARHSFHSKTHVCGSWFSTPHVGRMRMFSHERERGRGCVLGTDHRGILRLEDDR